MSIFVYKYKLHIKFIAFTVFRQSIFNIFMNMLRGHEEKSAAISKRAI